MGPMRHRQQRGDTLVEVVIAMAILSVVLITAFNLANLTFRLGVQARERTEAIHLAQQQLERLMLRRDQLTAQTLNTAAPDTVIFTALNFPGSAYRLQSDLSIESCATPCQERLYTIQVTSTRDIARLAQDRLVSQVRVSWISIINNQPQSIDVELPLADMRGLKLRNCEVATNPACIN